MANTTLRTYLNDLNLLLEQEALEEVIGHCRHILQHFPKNVDTYRVMGQALLARGRNEEAQEVFRRVLGAVPDDLIGHLGMSKASELSNLNEAVWHMERALEQQPHNLALRDDLRNLLNARDGGIPDQLRMTRGGLARMYLNSRLYNQALPLLQTALGEAPDRIDLAVLLARAYWQSGFESEAGEAALRVLDRQPDCIEANQIMAGLWLQHGRASDAQPFLSRLERLDPFTAWAILNPDGKQPPETAFLLPQLKWDARAAAQLATDVPDWVSDIGEVFETPELFSPSGPAFTAFQSDTTGTFTLPVGTSDPFGEGLARRSGIPGAPGASNPPQDSEPDWFKDIVVDSPSSTSSSNIPGGVPDWLTEEDETLSQAAPLDPLAWLQGDSVDEDTFEAEAESQFEPEPAVDPMAWLHTGPLDAHVVEAEPQPGATGISAVDPFAWMNSESVDARVIESEPEPVVADIPAVDPMAWLQTGSLDAAVVEPESEPEAVMDDRWALPSVAADQEELSVDWLLGDIPAAAGEETPALGVDFLLGQDEVMEPQFDNAAVPTASAELDLGLDWSQLEQAQSPTLPAEGFEWMEPSMESEGGESEGDLSWGEESRSLEAQVPAAELTPSQWDQTDDFAATLASEIGIRPDAPAAEETPALEGLMEGGDFDLSTLDLGDGALGGALGDLTPDWLRGSEIEPIEPSFSSEMGFESTPETITGGEFDWLNTEYDLSESANALAEPSVEMPLSLEGGESSVEEDDLRLDWLATGDLPPLQEGLHGQPLADDLDWMASAETGVPALDLTFETPEEAQYEAQGDQLETLDFPTAEAQPDPMSWFTQFQETGEVPAPPELVIEEPVVAEPSVENASEVAQFMAALMAQPEPGTEVESVIPPSGEASPEAVLGWLEPVSSEAPAAPGLEWMQPTSTPEPTLKDEEWFSTLNAVEVPAEKPPAVNITTSQFAAMFEDAPAAVTPPERISEPVIEDDWLAAFEAEESSSVSEVIGTLEPAAPVEPAEMDIAAMFEQSSIPEITLPPLISEEPSEPAADLVDSASSEPEGAPVPLYKRKVTTNLPRLNVTPGWADVGPTPTEETPSWMLEGDLFAPPPSETDSAQPSDQDEAQAHFEDLLRQTTERASQRPTTGELVGEFTDFETPDWLSAMTPDAVTSEPARVESAAPVADPNSIDFSSLFALSDTNEASFEFESLMEENEEAMETEEVVEAPVVPEWLLQMAPATDEQPDKRDTTPIEALDFGSLDNTEATSTDLFDQDLTTGTGAEKPLSPPESEPSEGDFTFKKAPAWKRKT